MHNLSKEILIDLKHKLNSGILVPLINEDVKIHIRALFAWVFILQRLVLGCRLVTHNFFLLVEILSVLASLIYLFILVNQQNFVSKPVLFGICSHIYVKLLSFQVSYKSFDEIQEEKKWWKLPFVSEFLKKNGFESALKMVGGSEGVSARQFVDYAFGQLKSFNDAYILKDQSSSSGDIQIEGEEKSENGAVVSDMPSKMESSSDVSVNNKSSNEESNVEEIYTHKAAMDEGDTSEVMAQVTETKKSDKHFWKNFADIVNQNVVQKLGLPVPEKLKWDAFDLLNRAGLQSQKIAEANYVESGLATPQVQDVDNDKASGSSTSNAIQSALPDIKKATKDLLKQTDSVLGALMVLTTAVSQLNKDETKGESSSEVEDDASRYLLSEKLPRSIDGSMLDEKKAEEMKALFSTAETAMEAWAMLASSLGHPSFIKSEFEKICFLDNESTDTQVIYYLIVILFLSWTSTHKNKIKIKKRCFRIIYVVKCLNLKLEDESTGSNLA